MKIQISLSASTKLRYSTAEPGAMLARKFKGTTYVGVVTRKQDADIEVNYDDLGIERYTSDVFDTLIERGAIKRATTAQINAHGGNKRQTRHRASADAHAKAESKLKASRDARMVDQNAHDAKRAFAMVEEAKNHSLSPSQRDQSLNGARDFAVRKKVGVVNPVNHEMWRVMRDYKVERLQPYWDASNRELEPTGFRFVLPDTDRFVSIEKTKSGNYRATYGDGSKRWQKKVVRSRDDLRDFLKTVKANY